MMTTAVAAADGYDASATDHGARWSSKDSQYQTTHLHSTYKICQPSRLYDPRTQPINMGSVD